MARGLHPNSLANLKKAKPKHHEYGARYSITHDKIDQIITLLVSNNMSLKKTADAAGVHFSTLKKYYTKGDPRRGIEPLRSRVLIYYKNRNQRFDGELLEREKEHLKCIRETIKAINNEIKIGAADYKISDLTRLIRLEREILGAGESDTSEGLLTAEEIRDLERRSEASDTQGVSQVQGG